MRLSIALLTIAVSASTSAVSEAGCLTNWFRGRSAYSVQYAPYAVGYAPVVTTQPYAVQYAPAQVAVQSAFAQAVPIQSTSVLRPPTGYPPLATSGAYQVQRPTYYDNPSVYTGRPVIPTAQTTYRVPLTSLGGTGGGAFVGSANQYPSTYASNYASAYGAAQVPVTSPGLPMQVTNPSGLPASSMPATAVPPLYPPTQAQPRTGGLSRFFGSLFDTNYRTSYYRAPVTYYRPVTTIDPVSGAAVIVQQPCTSYAQQIQRTPYRSLQPAPTQTVPTTFPQTLPSTCQNAPLTSPYGPTTYPSGNAYPSGAVGQASAIGPINGGTGFGTGIGQVGATGPTGPSITPIPSTSPMSPPSTYQQPGSFAQPGLTPAPLSPAPLTGAPPTTTAPSGSGDLAPVDQPRLENYPPTTPPKAEASGATAPTDSYWKLQDAEDSSVFLDRSQVDRVAEDRERWPDPVSLQADRLGVAQPIEAPADYVSPFTNRTFQAEPKAASGEVMPPPALPMRSTEPSEMTSVSKRAVAPKREPAFYREAGLVRPRASRPATPRTEPAVKRDTAWYAIEP